MKPTKRLAFLNGLFGLEGKTAVCIGGGGALCGEMSRGLSMAGAHVIIADISEETGRARVDRIVAEGGTAEFCEVDVRRKGDMEAVVTYLKEQGRNCDVLVNAPGVNQKLPFLEVTDDDWDRILAINLTGVRNACQVFGAYMVSCGAGGSIINIGSVTSWNPLSEVSTYAVSKVGVLSLTKSVAQEFAKHDIRANAILPGFFPAEQNIKLLTPERREAIFRQTMMGRFGGPEELVGVVLLLASPTAGSLITAAAYAVDGGFTSFTL